MILVYDSGKKKLKQERVKIINVNGSVSLYLFLIIYENV